MTTKVFSFTHSLDLKHTIRLEEQISFPLRTPVRKYFRQLVAKCNVPESAQMTLYNEFKTFVDQETTALFMNHYDSALADLADGVVDVGKLCTRLDEAYRKNVSGYASAIRVTDDQLFGQAYNRVVHSPQAMELIRLEQSLAQVTAWEVEKRDNVLNRLDHDLMRETDSELQKRDLDVPEAVTRLQESHIRGRELEESRWNSCISELKRQQRRDLRDFVMSMEVPLTAEESRRVKPDAVKAAGRMESGLQATPPTVRPSSGRSLTGRSSAKVAPIAEVRPWSHSFTVQLGRQLRTTCDFRLIRADPMDLLSNFGAISSVDSSSLGADNLAERLSNALGIYSSALNGMVILVDRRINSFRGIKRRLAESCERSTEFHFPELGCQLTAIQETVTQLGQRSNPGDQRPSAITRAAFTETRDPGARVSEPEQDPLHGDVYITKHSNLAGRIGGLAGGGGGMSVLFQLVHEEARREEDRIRTGSPLYLALYGILRTCFDYDVTTLSIPLLLVPALCEYMDATWRARRAESVFKALKGALMELSTWRGPVVRSVQFLVPSDIGNDEMETLGQIVTSSFLQPVPLRA